MLDYRSEEKVYAFETAEIRGTLRPGNEFPHHGLTHLVHKATGVDFVHPLYAILNLYRFMHRDPAGGGATGHGQRPRQSTPGRAPRRGGRQQRDIALGIAIPISS